MTEWEVQATALVNNTRRTAPEMAGVLHACVMVVNDLARDFNVLDYDTRDKVRILYETFESVQSLAPAPGHLETEYKPYRPYALT